MGKVSVFLVALVLGVGGSLAFAEEADDEALDGGGKRFCQTASERSHGYKFSIVTNHTALWSAYFDALCPSGDSEGKREILRLLSEDGSGGNKTINCTAGQHGGSVITNICYGIFDPIEKVVAGRGFPAEFRKGLDKICKNSRSKEGTVNQRDEEWWETVTKKIIMANPLTTSIINHNCTEESMKQPGHKCGFELRVEGETIAGFNCTMPGADASSVGVAPGEQTTAKTSPQKETPTPTAPSETTSKESELPSTNSMPGATRASSGSGTSVAEVLTAQGRSDTVQGGGTGGIQNHEEEENPEIGAQSAPNEGNTEQAQRKAEKGPDQATEHQVQLGENADRRTELEGGTHTGENGNEGGNEEEAEKKNNGDAQSHGDKDSAKRRAEDTSKEEEADGEDNKERHKEDPQGQVEKGDGTQQTSGENTNKGDEGDQEGTENGKREPETAGENKHHHEQKDSEGGQNNTEPHISALQSSHSPDLKLSLLSLMPFL